MENFPETASYTSFLRIREWFFCLPEGGITGNQKYCYGQAFTMRYSIILAFTLAVCGCLVVAGCTSGTQPVTPTTTVPTPAPTTPPATLTVPPTVQTTEPVQTLPPERQVTLLLTKDRPTSEIHLLYQGGPGEIFVTKILLRVYAQDGTSKEYVMSNAQKPIPGDEIVAPGTRNPDRCEVFVISSGMRYKVIDEAVTGGGYY